MSSETIFRKVKLNFNDMYTVLKIADEILDQPKCFIFILLSQTVLNFVREH